SRLPGGTWSAGSAARYRMARLVRDGRVWDRGVTGKAALAEGALPLTTSIPAVGTYFAPAGRGARRTRRSMASEPDAGNSRRMWCLVRYPRRRIPCSFHDDRRVEISEKPKNDFLLCRRRSGRMAEW